MRVVINTRIDPDIFAQVIPLKTRRLAGFAANAFRRVDELITWKSSGRESPRYAAAGG